MLEAARYSFVDMSFPNLYREVKELTHKWLLTTANARAIFRKAGIRLGGTSEFIGHQDTLWRQGWMYNIVPSESWYINPFPRPGVWGIWPVRTWETTPYTVPGQYAFTDLRGIAFVRAVVNITFGGGTPTLVYVPCYTSTLNPMESRLEGVSSMSRWYTPDGRTLFEWDEDLRPGGVRAFSWPPPGACHPTEISSGEGTFALIEGLHAGNWAPPPREALGEDEVVASVAVIVNATQEELDNNTYQYLDRSIVQLQSIAQETPAWRAHFSDRIDD